MSRRTLRFYTPKNWERRKCQQQSLLVHIPRPIAEKAIFLAQLKRIELEGWTKLCVSSTEGIRLCRHDHSGLQSVVSITVNIVDGKSAVYVGSRAVTSFEQAVPSFAELLSLLDKLSTHKICSAIDDIKYKPLIEKHGGIFHDGHGNKV